MSHTLHAHACTQQNKNTNKKTHARTTGEAVVTLVRHYTQAPETMYRFHKSNDRLRKKLVESCGGESSVHIQLLIYTKS